MRPLPNNDLHRFPSERGKGLAGTVLIHLVVLALLLIFGFTPPPPPEFEEGIIVNFGTDLTGSGLIEPSAPPVQEEASVPLPQAVQPAPAEKALLTQNTEEAPEIKKVDPEIEKRRLEKIEADRIAREQIEAERKKKELEEAERKRIEAEQKRQADIMNRTRDALASSKNAGTTSTGEGTAGGAGNQGVPTGAVDSKVRGDGSGLGDKGISYDLGGRGFQSLPEPRYEYQVEGRVVVEVSVDREGRVTQATAGFKGSTTLDENLLRVAREAAMKARFEPKPDAPLIQKGTITYNFVLK
ncbi:MAG: TonB family protein [Bacteroidales bacterium]|nr:TonB family protein [Bacteroidales bacterium]